MAQTLSEHLEYLTLKGRYDLFQQAIEAVLSEGDVVADLGCGIGILGFQCLSAGASKVYGIDNSQAIHIAREAAERAGFTDRYTCIAGSTFETVLPEQVDLLICDHIGYFGFDYGIVDMLRDAARRMLKTGGRIIPDRLALRAAAVSSDRCLAKAAAWVQPEIPAEFAWLDDYGRNTKYSHEFEKEELSSKAIPLGEIALSEGDQAIYSFATEIEISRDGRFDGVAGWFEAHLGGGVWMTNSPIDESSIGRPQAFLPVKKPFEVRKGDRIGFKLRAGSDGKMIAWEIQPPGGKGGRQQLSTWASMILSGHDLQERADKPAQLTEQARAGSLVLSLVDGNRTPAQIEQMVLETHPDLFPTDSATRDFVRNILARNTKT